MEAKDQIRPEPPGQIAQEPGRQCVECLETVSDTAAADTTTALLAGRRGETLCTACAKNYYVACAACHGLVPQDEALTQADAVYCVDCAGQGAGAKAGEALDEAEVESLVSEFIELHTQEKRIKDRLDAIKEQLKATAASRQRVAGAVTLPGGAEGDAVKCSFKTNLKCIPEQVSALEERLEPDKFAALFERKVSYSPVKDGLEKFLAGDGDGTDEDLRQSVLAAVERTETPTLTVIRPKK